MFCGETQVKFRKRRIAWSVVWGLTCVLLIALWVRSYWWIDEIIRVSPTSVCECCTYDGQIVFSKSDDARTASAYMSSRGEGWLLNAAPVETWHKVSPPLPGQRIIRAFSTKQNEFVVPFWAASLIAATLGAFPWIHSRFSLRTLLIATTLVALVLGIIAVCVHETVQ
jgi:hypothetical protein